MGLTGLVVLALSSCASLRGAPRLPPITEGAAGEHQVGKFVWFDLLTEDPDAAREFYRKLFAWTFDDSHGGPSGYGVIRHNGVAIGGVAEIENALDASEAIWLASLSVADVDAAVKVARDHGGEVLDGPVDVAGRGRMAILRDPTGAEISILRSATGDPADTAREIGAWLWVDLVTNDGETAESFYRELVGYRSETLEVGEGSVYHVVGRDGRARAGIVEVQWEKVESNWLPYVAVADLDATLRDAQSLGGTILFQTGDAAVLTDPTGAAIGVQQLARGAE